jgi:hypothetical protein
VTESGSPWVSATLYGAAVAQMPQAPLPSPHGQITTVADNHPAHDDVHRTIMIKMKGKPAREAQRRLTGEEIGSWTELKTEIDGGGTITLAANFDCNYNSSVDNYIEIVNGQDVTVHANGAICNAQQGGRFFYVRGGATLTLNGMTLKNGSGYNVSVFTLCFSGWPFVTLLQHPPSCNPPFPQPPPCEILL